MTERKGGSDVGEIINISFLSVCRFLFYPGYIFICSIFVLILVSLKIVTEELTVYMCRNGVRHMCFFSLCSKWNRNNGYSAEGWNLQIVRLQMVLICHRQRHEYYIGAYC